MGDYSEVIRKGAEEILKQNLFSDAARLMQYFKKPDPDDMSQGALSERIHYLKREEGGNDEMCKAAEVLYNQGKEQGQLETTKAMAINMHNDGVTVDLIAKYANVSVELVRKWLGLSVA